MLTKQLPWLDPPMQLVKVVNVCLNVGGVNISLLEHVCDLGVIKQHANTMACSCFCLVQQLHSVRWSLTFDVLWTLFLTLFGVCKRYWMPLHAPLWRTYSAPQEGKMLWSMQFPRWCTVCDNLPKQLHTSDIGCGRSIWERKMFLFAWAYSERLFKRHFINELTYLRICVTLVR